MSLSVAALGFGGTDPQAPNTRPALVQTLTTYFQTEDPEQRKKIVDAVNDATEGNWRRVADALPELHLWVRSWEPPHHMEFLSPTGQTKKLFVKCPITYNQNEAFPLLLVQGGTPALGSHCSPGYDIWRDFAKQEPGSGFLVSLNEPLTRWHHQDGESAGDLQAMLYELQKRFRIDTDRLYLLAIGDRDDSLWMTAFMHGDRFAGARFIHARPHVPFPNQGYPLLLGNLRNLPTNIEWFQPLPGHAEVPEWEVVAQHLRAIALHARTLDLPLTVYNMPNDPPPTRDQTAARKDRIKALFSSRRNLLEKRVSHWFRYPAQGHDRWLRVTKMAGNIWTSDQLSILPGAGTDQNDFITEVIKDKLGYIGGTIDGQSISIETRRCSRIELILYDGLIDWREPVTVTINGTKRFEGIIEPNIETILDSAYRTWDFQHPVGAIRSFSIRSSTKR